MKKKWMASLALILASLAAEAATTSPSFISLDDVPSGMGVTEALVYWTGIAEKLGPDGLVIVGNVDRALPVVSVVVALARAAYACEVARKTGDDCADGAVDNLIFQAGWGLIPGYTQTDKTVSTAFVNLASDPSLDGSYLSESIHQQEADTTAKRRAAAEAFGKELYGPGYQLPAGYTP